MTPSELRAARKRLGLSRSQMARALRLSSITGKRTIEHWESGERPITGPAQVAIELMLKAASETESKP